ncbi:MAG TPA: hypothetical protein VFC53_02805 [Dehalococcoidia bacterium]|nr:hypothetical protein [Dehalococcoidia bacterium]
MRRLIAAGCIGAALLLAACSGGGGSDDSVRTTASSRTPEITATPTSVPIPDRPAALADYAPAVAAYLRADPGAADGTPCLAALVQAWYGVRPAPSSCVRLNADADPELELAIVLTAPEADPGLKMPSASEVAIFDVQPGAASVAYVSPPVTIFIAATGEGASIIDGGDLLGDGAGAMAYGATSCGAHTCTLAVHVVRGTATGYTEVTPADGITLATATARFADTDGDGRKELVLTGGEIGSVGAGPQRPRTDTWAWDGAAYALRSSVPGPSDYLYHAVIDAGALFDAGNYAAAERAYLAVVDNTSLKEWTPEKHERAELESYALFRAGLAVLAAGGDPARALDDFHRADNHTTLHGQLAASFSAGCAAKQDIRVGCAAVRDDLAANADEYAAFWDFGYGNPAFDPSKVCPF